MSTLLSVKVPIPEEVVRVSDSEGFAVRGLSPTTSSGSTSATPANWSRCSSG